MFTEALIGHRMDSQIAELETTARLTGQIIESLPLSLGGTCLSREVFQDGSKADEIHITTREAHGLMGDTVVYARYKIADGRIVTDTPTEKQRKITPLRKLRLFARVAFGRPDHWAMESDFYGRGEEDL